MEFALRCDHNRIRGDMTHAPLPPGNGFLCDESPLPLHSLSRQSRAVNGGVGMERVLITGGNGFIGSHLAERLVDRGDAVTLFDNHFDSNSRHLSCAKIRGDVRHFRTIREAVSGQDAVFHFAAVSRVAWGQTDPYNCCRTKLCAERACRSYADPTLSRPIKSVIFRFSNVYGSERDLPERVIPKFMRKALQGEDITLYGGEQVLDFTFIDDTIQGILRAYDASMDGGKDLLGQEFHFVTGRGVSVSDLADMIIALTDSSAQVVLGPANNFDVRKFVGSPAKSYKLLGYEAKVTLEAGLKRLRDRTLSSAIKTVASADRTASIGA